MIEPVGGLSRQIPVTLMASPTTPLPLQGLKVFDLGQGVAAPFCTMMLAAQGADVIKVEPAAGDWIRANPVRYRGHTAASLAFNIGKRSLALDLKRPSAQALARRIALGCDVFVENFRTGVTDRLGLGRAALAAARPELVYASISGFGAQGPLAGRGAVDPIAQAFSGWMVLNAGDDGVPQRTRSTVLADQICGLYASQAIAHALLRRFRFGQGAHLEITLVGAMAAFIAPRILAALLGSGEPPPARFPPPTGEYATGDGLLTVASHLPSGFAPFCDLIGRPELKTDPRFETPAARAAHAAALKAEIESTLATRSAGDWETLLNDGGVMAAAVRSVGAFLADPQTRAMGLVREVELAGMGACPVLQVPGAPSWTDRPHPPTMPQVGEHGRDILREAGLTAGEIEAHVAEGDVLEPAPA